jgi:hypothetical protein
MKKGLVAVVGFFALSTGLGLTVSGNDQTVPFTAATTSLGPESVWMTFLCSGARS